MNIRTLFNRAFMETKWYCGYRILPEEEMNSTAIPNVQQNRSYHVVQIPDRYWIADPFLMVQDGETHLFFEYMDRYRQKAVLAEIKIDPDEVAPHCVYEFEGHTSYPCIFEFEGKKYMIPETAYANSLQLLTCTEWPDKWKKVGDLLEGLRVADCTPFEYDGQMMIFVYGTEVGSREHKLYIGELDIEQCCIRKLSVAAQYHDNLGRPGGHVFMENGKHIRVVQPGTHFYGEKLEFYEFTITDGVYHEKKIGEYLPQQVTLDQKVKIAGIHTFNRCGNIEVIDIQPVKSIHLFRPLRLLLQILNIGCFGLCDRRKQYLNGKRPAHLS